MATVAELKAQAKELGIKGYSKMLKSELESAIKAHGTIKPMTNKARIQNYNWQNFMKTRSVGKLTVAQQRRIRKKARKNG